MCVRTSRGYSATCAAGAEPRKRHVGLGLVGKLCPLGLRGWPADRLVFRFMETLCPSGLVFYVGATAAWLIGHGLVGFLCWWPARDEGGLGGREDPG